MESTPKLSREEFLSQMRQEVEHILREVANAINDPAPGRIISGSEEKVRDLFADERKHAFEKGLQMRLDAAEAAFPSSEGPEFGQDETQ